MRWNDPPPHRVLNTSKAGLTKFDYQSIRMNPGIGYEIIFQLLIKYMPESFHTEILIDAKVPMHETDSNKTNGLFQMFLKSVRNHRFRQLVLPEYQYMCAVCHLSLQSNPVPNYLALVAAHIKAVSYDGPDKISNGLSLCSNLHTFFDRGAFTINPTSNQFSIEVSDKIVINEKDLRLSPYDRKSLHVPLNAYNRPELEFIEWHRENVFVS